MILGGDAWRDRGIQKPSQLMSKKISLLFSRTNPGAQGSVAYVNSVTKEALVGLGLLVRPFFSGPDPLTQESLIPMALAGAHASGMQGDSVDFALHDDAGVLMRTPARRWARRNLVMYHGLAYGAGSWMGNPDIDLHCANSPYLAQVIRSILAFPNWSARRCLDPRAFDVVTDLALHCPASRRCPRNTPSVKGRNFPSLWRG